MEPMEMLAQVFNFLVASGIIYVVAGAIATIVLGRFAVIPTLKKIDRILDIIILKCEDGECTPADAEEIMKVIKEEIGSDAAYRLIAWIQRRFGGGAAPVQTFNK